MDARSFLLPLLPVCPCKEMYGVARVSALSTSPVYVSMWYLETKKEKDFAGIFLNGFKLETAYNYLGSTKFPPPIILNHCSKFLFFG